jgi:hypothetical protein
VLTAISGVAFLLASQASVLLPNADEAAAMALAERLRGQIAAAPLAHHGKTLGHITILLGLAISPGDGPHRPCCAGRPPPCWRPSQVGATGP